MKLYVECVKCGEPIPVEAEMVSNAVAMGDEIRIAHSDCGALALADAPPAAPTRRFRVQLVFVEPGPDGDVDWDPVADLIEVGGHEVLAWIGMTASAENFAKAVNGAFTNWLNEAWPKLQEQAALADLPARSG